MTVKVLPSLDFNLGFPQKIRVAINTGETLKAYDFLFRWNDAQFICEITRVEDSAIMWRGVVNKFNPIEIKDPDRYDVQFTMMARELDKDLELFETWVFEE